MARRTKITKTVDGKVTFLGEIPEPPLFINPKKNLEKPKFIKFLWEFRWEIGAFVVITILLLVNKII